MDLIERATLNFEDNLSNTRVAIESVVEPLARSAQSLTQCLMSGGKVITCGNASSSLLAEYMASMMLGRVQLPRPALPAVCLSTSMAINGSIASDNGLSQVYANQLQALGQQGDTLFTFSDGVEDLSLLAAIRVAHERSLSVITLGSEPSDELTGILHDSDIVIDIPASNRLRQHELQVLAVHCICDLIDNLLMGPA